MTYQIEKSFVSVIDKTGMVLAIVHSVDEAKKFIYAATHAA